MSPQTVVHTEMEEKRLQALRSYNIINMLPEAELDAITRLAASVCGTSMALISLIEENRSWFASNLGMPGKDSPRDASFCQHTILQNGVYEVTDASKHELYSQLPLVKDNPYIRYYAGAPLVTPDGYNLGALCVVGTKPGSLDPKQKDTLQLLAGLVMSQFELRKKRAVLEEQIGLYHTRVEDVGDIIYTSDIQGNFTFINRKVTEILGYTSEELIGTGFRELIVPGWRDKVTAFYQNQFKEKKEQTAMEFPVITKAGSPRWVEQTVTAYVKNGKILEFHGVVRDVEERKISEQKLIDSEAKFFSLFTLSPVPMALVCVESGFYTEVNNAFTVLLGYSNNELIDKTVRQSGMFAEDTLQAVRESVSRRERFKGKEICVKTKSGDEIHVMFSTEIVEIEEKPHILSIYHDISERKELENELIKTRDLALQSALAKEQFLANMSHEIRTPMNAVLGFTDLLAETQLNDEQTDFVDSIQSAGKSLMAIINDILDYSKIEAGMMQLEESALSIRSTFASLEKMFFTKAQQKNLQLVFKSDANIPEVVLGDPTRLTQIIINLAGNALKFTQTGGVKLVADVLEKEDTRVKVRFQVHDTGIGIPQEKLASVFDRFNQVTNDTTRKYGGTGLGLSIAKKLVELQGGTISVSSVEGTGSVFEFIIPFAYDKNATWQHAEPNTKEKSAGKSLRILLAEDNVLNQKLAGKVLGNMGHTVDVADNGRIAVEKIKENTYDLVLMDMQMPEMDGYETAVFIRRKLKNTVPIIAMTAHAMAGEREACVKLGMNEYVSKPFKAHELEFKINQLTGNFSRENKQTLQWYKGTCVCIDLEGLFALSNGDTSFIKEVLGIFITETPVQMKELSKKVAEREYTGVKQISHKFISSIQSLGLQDRLHDALVEMETLAAEGKNDRRMDEINLLVQRVCRGAVNEAKLELNKLT